MVTMFRWQRSSLRCKCSIKVSNEKGILSFLGVKTVMFQAGFPTKQSLNGCRVRTVQWLEPNKLLQCPKLVFRTMQTLLTYVSLVSKLELHHLTAPCLQVSIRLNRMKWKGHYLLENGASNTSKEALSRITAWERYAKVLLAAPTVMGIGVIEARLPSSLTVWGSNISWPPNFNLESLCFILLSVSHFVWQNNTIMNHAVLGLLLTCAGQI